MTETRVIIDNDREATPDQMVTMQDGIEDSLDHVVLDAVSNGQAYAGMIATFSGTVVTIGAGRVYNAGKVYAYDTAGTFDMLAQLPSATKKAVLIVAYGVEQDTDVQAVNYLIEAQSTPTNPVFRAQSVATTHKRVATVQPNYGNEAPNPVTPDAGLAVPVALIYLSPAGITSCVNLVANKVPNLADVAGRTATLEIFEATAGPEIDSLRANLAALASKGSGVSPDLIGRILLSIADLDAKANIPSNAADSSSDFLLDGSTSSLTDVRSNCLVSEGIRFPYDGIADAVLNVFNPYDPNAMVKGGVLFPAYDEGTPHSYGPPTGHVAANAYQYANLATYQATMSRARIRYGASYVASDSAIYWGATGSPYDPVADIFALPTGDTFTTLPASTGQQPGFTIDQSRDYGYWADTVDETYWLVLAASGVRVNADGYALYETFLNGSDFWMSSIGFQLAAKDAQGDITVLITHTTDAGAPDPSKVIGTVTMAAASLVADSKTVNKIAFQTPIRLQAGRRFSVVLSTIGAHQFCTTDGSNFQYGTFGVYTSTGFATADLTKHLCLVLYPCKFRNSLIDVQLQNLQLAGGMTAIDIVAGMAVPSSTSITFSVQIAGAWLPLNKDTVGQLNAGGSLPPNLPLKVTFAGSANLMPALDLGHSNARVTRQKTSLANIWPKNPRTPPVSTAAIRVFETLENFDPVFHTAGAQLLTGTGYATATNPSSFSDVQQSDGSTLREYIFNLGAAVSSYKVLSTGTTTSALKPFDITPIRDYVQ